MLRRRRGGRGEKRPPERTEKVNEEIRSQTVRVVTEDKEALGVLSIAEALAAARERGADLVEIASNADPPVCKIIDYGKFRFEQQKREKEAKKKQKVIHVKEIKFRPKIDVHDFTFKMNHVKKFLEAGDKVKITIMFRGREMSHTELGYDVINKVVEDLGDTITVEKKAKMEGRNLTMFIAPTVKMK